MTNNHIESVTQVDASSALASPLLWTGIATVVLAIIGMIYFRNAVLSIGASLSNPDVREYKIATASYPDALIIKFGVQEQLRSLPAQITFMSIPWSMMLWNLRRNLVDVIYSNRRIAGRAMFEDPDVVASQKTLCVYKAFAICLRPEVLVKAELKPGKLDQTALKAAIKFGRILIQKDTDQGVAVKRLLDEVLKEAGEPAPSDNSVNRSATHIMELESSGDPLETILAGRDGTSDVIGFAAGITERVVAEKLGWGVIAQPEVLPTHFEINSFVYNSPREPQEVTALPYILLEVERLWDETVERLMSEPETQERFRKFLNEQITPELGKLTLEKLDGAEPFSNDDMKRMLSEWLQFPGRSRPVVIAVGEAA